QPTWAKITQTVHGKGQRADPRGPKSPKQSTGRASVLSPRTNMLICVLMDSHGRPVCADGHRRTHTDTNRQPRTSCVCWRTPTDVLCVLDRQPTWAKITRTVHRKGQRAESKDQHADMCTDGQPQTSCTRWAKITQTVHGKGQCAEFKNQRADICTDGRPRTSCVC
ncbi:unnamed protein product, partial [Brassica rapa]